MKVNREPTPAFGLDPDGSAMEFHELAGDGEAEACAAVLAVGCAVTLRERFEDPVELLGGDAYSGVDHRDLKPWSQGLRKYLDGSSRRELEGITDEIEQDLLDPILIGLGKRNQRRDTVEDAQRPLADERLRNGQHKVDQGMQVGRAAVQLDRLVAQLGEVEKVVDQIGETAATGHDHRQIAPLLVAQRPRRPVDHRLADADDAVQRRAQLVRGVGQELVLQRVGPQQRLLGLLASGDVADDAGEASSSVPADLAQRELQREGRPVAAQPLDLATHADHPRLARAQVAGEVGIVVLPVRRGHEHRDIATDQIGRRIAEQPLDGRIGDFHDASFVDGDDPVDGRIQDRLDARLALPKCLLRLLPLADVADETREETSPASAHFAERQLDREGRSVPPQRLQLAAHANDLGLARAQVVGKILVMPLAMGLRHQHGHVAAEQLGGRIGEQALDRRVDALDDALLVDGDDRIDGGLENGLDVSSFAPCCRFVAPASAGHRLFIHGWSS